MAEVWKVLIVILTLIEMILSHLASFDREVDMPLTRSLGYSMRTKLRTLEDARLSQEYLELYQDMMKASQESLERIDDQEQEKLEQMVGKEGAEIMKRGVQVRRRGSRLRSKAGGRRARSQASRRERLNSQSLRSHLHHIRQASQQPQLHRAVDLDTD